MLDQAAQREARLKIRAHYREHNDTRPRCAGCGGDMPIFNQRDIVTPSLLVTPGYEYLVRADFRPGDIVCFWCVCNLIDGLPHLVNMGGHA